MPGSRTRRWSLLLFALLALAPRGAAAQLDTVRRWLGLERAIRETKGP